MDTQAHECQGPGQRQCQSRITMHDEPSFCVSEIELVKCGSLAKIFLFVFCGTPAPAPHTQQTRMPFVPTEAPKCPRCKKCAWWDVLLD